MKMKNLIQLFGVLLIFSLFGCADKANFSGKELKKNEKIYWVAGTMVDCIGVGKMNCIQIQVGDKIEKGNWTLFYNDIDGFVYEPGYIYKLIVREQILAAENLPADVSNLKVSLVKVLKKKRAM